MTWNTSWAEGYDLSPVLNKSVDHVAGHYLAPETRSASGESAWVDDVNAAEVHLDLDVTAVAGLDPALTVILYTAPVTYPPPEEVAVVGAWREVGRFPVKTGVGSQRLTLCGLDAASKAVYLIAGTGASFEFSLAGKLIR